MNQLHIPTSPPGSNVSSVAIRERTPNYSPVEKNMPCSICKSNSHVTMFKSGYICTHCIELIKSNTTID